jgi:hypothetical protein
MHVQGVSIRKVRTISEFKATLDGEMERFARQPHGSRVALPDLGCPLFDKRYPEMGRHYIPPERLPTAKNLQFRWSMNPNLTDPLWNNSTFPKTEHRPAHLVSAWGAIGNGPSISCGCHVDGA